MVHELKTWKEYFQMVVRGDKPFELRKNDRNFIGNDELLLREFDNETKEYTGRILHRRITYVLKGKEAEKFGLKDGYCILGLDKV